MQAHPCLCTAGARQRPMAIGHRHRRPWLCCRWRLQRRHGRWRRGSAAASVGSGEGQDDAVAAVGGARQQRRRDGWRRQCPHRKHRSLHACPRAGAVGLDPALARSTVHVTPCTHCHSAYARNSALGARRHFWRPAARPSACERRAHARCAGGGRGQLDSGAAARRRGGAAAHRGAAAAAAAVEGQQRRDA